MLGELIVLFCICTVILYRHQESFDEFYKSMVERWSAMEDDDESYYIQ